MNFITLTPAESQRRYQATIAILADMIADLPAAEPKSEEAEYQAEIVNVLDRGLQ